MTAAFPVERIRSRFPGLRREVGGQPAIFLDGPAGSQVPQGVIEAMGDYLAHTNANVGGGFATGVESDRLLHGAHQAMADLVGAGSPDEIVFGANMTSLTFLLSAALARTWQAGDEVVVTRVDHEANVTPWVEAARDAGARVRQVGVVAEDCSLDLDELRAVLSPRTRLVAVAAASNLTGTIHPVAEVARLAHEVGALVFVDAVHYAPHRAVDVAALDCDFLCCSAYKFFGPHVGVLWGREDLLRELPVRKLQSASQRPPGRWMRGTQNHEGIAGTAAAVDYLAALGHELAGERLASRRAALVAAFAAIAVHEEELSRALLQGLAEQPELRVWGVRDLDRLAGRTATFALTHARQTPRRLASHLTAAGIFAWPGNSYALPLTTALGLEPDGVLRVGFLHYNTLQDVQRLLATLRHGE